MDEATFPLLGTMTLRLNPSLLFSRRVCPFLPCTSRPLLVRAKVISGYMPSLSGVRSYHQKEFAKIHYK